MVLSNNSTQTLIYIAPLYGPFQWRLIYFAFGHQVVQLLKRIEALESAQKDSVEDGLARLSNYGLRRQCDFDKYIALSMADDLVNVARDKNHDKAPFLAAAAQALRDRLEKPIDQFKAYFLALFSDQDYTKILDAIAKVDKALKVEAKGAPSSQPTSSAKSQRSQIFCHYCGAPGHTAPQCFKRRNRRFYSPYNRAAGRGRPNNNM